MGNEIITRHRAKRIIDLSEIALELGFLFNPVGNFSLLQLPNGNWFCSMRVFGYFISSATHAYLTQSNMKLEHPDAQLFLELDRDFNLVRRFNLVENDYYRVPEFDRETPYLEDGRLVKWGDEIYLTSAIFYQNNAQYQKFGLEVQRLEFDGEDVRARHCWSSVQQGIMGRHKNWMAVEDRPFKFVIGTSRNGAQTIDIQSGIIGEVCDYDAKDLYRGNTNLLKDGTGYCAITHRLGMDEHGRKKYLNYLTRYNGNLLPVEFSKPFKFCGESIEFVTCLLELPDNEILVCVTEMDDLPEIHIYDKDVLLELVSKE